MRRVGGKGEGGRRKGERGRLGKDGGKERGSQGRGEKSR